MSDPQSHFQGTPLCLGQALAHKSTITGPLLGVDQKSSQQQKQQQADTDIDPSHCFPIRIRTVPGRGRGYFAARDIAQGETVLIAVPLACAISEDWVKNTCWWCFTYNSRKAHSVGAADNEISSTGHSEKQKQPKQSVQYKGVFCSTECKEQAILAHGGHKRWHSYVALFGAIDSEVRAFKSRQKQQQRPSFTASQHLSSRVHYLAAPDTSLSTFADTPLAIVGKGVGVATSWDIDFDPDDFSDQQLSDWVSRVWDVIVAHKLFQKHLPESSQRELVRLIANAICLEDAESEYVAPENWQMSVVSLEGAERDFSPSYTLLHVRDNEIDCLRTKLRKLQSETPADSAAPSPQTPATLAPIRLPIQPTPDLIEQSQWGAAAFKTAASAFMLLVPAWRRTAKTHLLGKLTHERFRAVYYREMANSFGIWESVEDDVGYASPTIDSVSKQQQHVQPKGAESECLGFTIYSTAVYFNHSCAPNVRKTRKQRTMHFVSCRDIAQDEELFIAYGSVADSGPERRQRLQDHFFFECTCDRCLAEATQCLELDSKNVKSI
ncbi:hypothetical protein EV175_002215 [Coemansia sp. RSA 1933]|nr:hypothetical protein EV175_002215 [Coemansia sp. RSA 1933]